MIGSWYSIRIHDRLVEDDPRLATVMYSPYGVDGPWFDMATGVEDHVEDILGALRWCEDERSVQRADEITRLQKEVADLAEYDQFDNPVTPPNKNDIPLVQRLRLINPYSPTQVLEICAEAADALEECHGW